MAPVAGTVFPAGAGGAIRRWTRGLKGKEEVKVKIEELLSY
jgi:hypothetical protein